MKAELELLRGIHSVDALTGKCLVFNYIPVSLSASPRLVGTQAQPGTRNQLLLGGAGQISKTLFFRTLKRSAPEDASPLAVAWLLLILLKLWAIARFFQFRGDAPNTKRGVLDLRFVEI